jgi:hypothetical protein
VTIAERELEQQRVCKVAVQRLRLLRKDRSYIHQQHLEQKAKGAT